jgi:hypothetical protein
VYLLPLPPCLRCPANSGLMECSLTHSGPLSWDLGFVFLFLFLFFETGSCYDYVVQAGLKLVILLP